MEKKLIFLLFFIGAVVLTLTGSAQTIFTFAGSSSTGYSGDGGPASNARLGLPTGVTMDGNGNLYIADQNEQRIRKVDAFGIITTVAGNGGTGGYSGDGMAATASMLNWPEGVAADKAGNIYIADQYNQRVRKVDVAGIITTIAGAGSIGYSGDGGPATDASLYNPADVGVDTSGNVYFVEQDNHVIRRVSTSGIITTYAGNGTLGYSGDGGPATAAQLNYPQGLAVDTEGNVYIADFYNKRIRKVNTAGIITTVAGNGLGGYTGDGGPATAAGINNPSAVTIDKQGNIYMTDYYNYVVRKVSSAGTINTVAGNGTYGYSGDGGLALAAEFGFTQGITTDTNGYVYVADYSNSRIRAFKDTVLPTAIATDNKALPSFHIFPNPSGGQFILQSGTIPCAGTAEVHNVTGALVFSAAIQSLKTRIDLSGQPAGVYTLYVRSGENSCIQKLVISR